MAYEPHDWQTGEIITEELLDHMEQGIEEASEEAGAGSVFYIDLTYTIDAVYEASTCSAFSDEINTEYHKGKSIILRATQYGQANQINVGQLSGLYVIDDTVGIFMFDCPTINQRIQIGENISSVTMRQIS